MADQTTDGHSGKPAETGRALVIVGHPGIVGSDRPSAGFLAQLIACDRRLPAYRAARRTDPVAAATAYQCEIAHQAAVFQRLI